MQFCELMLLLLRNEMVANNHDEFENPVFSVGLQGINSIRHIRVRIGKRNPWEWPARSADLTSIDFFFGAIPNRNIHTNWENTDT